MDQRLTDSVELALEEALLLSLVELGVPAKSAGAYSEDKPGNEASVSAIKDEYDSASIELRSPSPGLGASKVPGKDADVSFQEA